jgi:hypothetical protein
MQVRYALAVVALWVAGCGDPKVVAVSGRVTLDGQPLAGAHVVFQPIAAAKDMNPGSGSYGITDADGRYTLTVVDTGQSGAFIGKHRVEITIRSDEDDDTDRRGRRPAAKVVLLPRYNRNSQLSFEVPAKGTKEADFPLTTKP